MSDWVEILQGFMKFNIKLNLKVSAFYLQKQKSFIPKKKKLSCCQYLNKKKSFLYRLNFPERFCLNGLLEKNLCTISKCLSMCQELDFSLLLRKKSSKKAMEICDVSFLNLGFVTTLFLCIFNQKSFWFWMPKLETP